MVNDGLLYIRDFLPIVATDISVEMMARGPAEKNRTSVAARYSI
jgi:hypothetical protein